MIQHSDISWQTQSWQSLLQTAVSDINQLCELLGLDSAQLNYDPDAAGQFAMRVPLPFIQRMERGNPNDPLLKQVLAVQSENLDAVGFTDDPLAERQANAIPGLLHKYQNRVLLTVTGSCAVHCRYCFRRHFDYSANNGGRQAWPAILSYLRDHPEVDEVILSGGDPLTAADSYLHQLIDRLAKLPSIKRLRIHTRVPVVIPQRILQADLSWLKLFTSPVVVLHINHANEIDSQVTEAVQRLRDNGSMVLNQAVLLAGINDNLPAQLDLHRGCYDAGILPYYLHLPDRVRGTAHFDVPIEQARQLFQDIRKNLSGYMVPTLVMEEAGAAHKTPLI